LCCLFFCLLVIVLSILLSFGHCVVYSSVFWPLCCLFFFDIRMFLISPLISSNSSFVYMYNEPFHIDQLLKSL
jgi:hypothetical protein